MEKRKQNPLHLPNDKRGYYVPSDFIKRAGKQPSAWETIKAVAQGRKVEREPNVYNASLKELKDEYTYIRDILRKRINRLEAQNVLPDYKLQEMRDMFPKIAELTGNIEINKLPKDERPFAENALKEKLINALTESSKLLNKGASTIPAAKEMKLSYQRALEDRLNAWGIDSTQLASKVDPFRFWQFVDRTKEIVKGGIMYATEAQIKYLFNTKDLIDKMNQGEFDDVFDAVMSVESEDDESEEY